AVYCHPFPVYLAQTADFDGRTGVSHKVILATVKHMVTRAKLVEAQSLCEQCCHSAPLFLTERQAYDESVVEVRTDKRGKHHLWHVSRADFTSLCGPGKDGAHVRLCDIKVLGEKALCQPGVGNQVG